MNPNFYDTIESEELRDPKWLRELRRERRWRKLRVFSIVIGRLMLLLEELKVTGLQPKWRPPKRTTSLLSTPWIIPPNSLFFILWASIMIILMLWTIIVLPYYICFIEMQSKELEIFQMIVDSMFILDIIITFNSAYIDEADQLVTERKKIAVKYLKSWFFVDLISSFPFEILNFYFEGEKSGYIKLFKLVRLPRIYDLLRITRIFKACRAFKSNTTIGEFMRTINVTEGMLRLIKFFFFIFCIIHVTSCFWYVIGQAQEEESWLFRYEIHDKEPAEKYLISVYYVFTTLTTVGYGDITPETPPEQFFALLLIFFGVGFYSYIIGNLTTFLDRLDVKKTALKDKLTVVGDILNKLKIPLEIQYLVNESLINSFNKEGINWNDAQILVSELPSALKSEVYYFLFEKTVKNIRFFQGKSLGALMIVVPKLTYLKKERESYLYFEESKADESKIYLVYFIEKGKVNFICSNGQRFRSMLEGGYFGEIELIINKNRIFSVEISSEKAEFLVFAKSDFFDFLSKFPEFKPEIRLNVEKRILKFALDIKKVMTLEPNESRIALISNSSSDSEIINDESDHLNFHRSDTNVLISNFELTSAKLKNINTWHKAISSNFLEVPYKFSKVKTEEDSFIKARKILMKTLIQKSERLSIIERKRSNTVFFTKSTPCPPRKSLSKELEEEYEFSDIAELSEPSSIEYETPVCSRKVQHKSFTVPNCFDQYLYTLADNQKVILENIRRTYDIINPK